RLLATLLVAPHAGGFLLQLARDLSPAVAKRLSMFILRAKVNLSDVSDAWVQFGVWGAGAAQQVGELGFEVPRDVLHCASNERGTVVRVAPERFLVLAPRAEQSRLAQSLAHCEEAAWTLAEIRDGHPQVRLATQDQFVPQMLNLERLGAVDFKKGCYPGQEVVARTQYRGVLKRRMVRARAPVPAAPGDDVFADSIPGQAAGTIVNAAALAEGGSEVLAVVQISALEASEPIHLREPAGPVLAPLALPYA
ncbi:MAG: folate-binding protein, partial [Betaproteobacteria bacterium]|nr:folate-binding protein [Betaproteobacteria bacterium]